MLLQQIPLHFLVTLSQSYVQGLGLLWRASCSLICRVHWQGHSEVPLLKPNNANWENCPCLVPLHARGHQPCMQTLVADLRERPICRCKYCWWGRSTGSSFCPRGDHVEVSGGRLLWIRSACRTLKGRLCPSSRSL